MNVAQRIVLAIMLLLLAGWSMNAPHRPWAPEALYPPPRYPLFFPGQPAGQELDSARAAVEILYLVALGGGLILVFGNRRAK
jgi:hypothetical protein